MSELHNRFVTDIDNALKSGDGFKLISVAVELPSGAIEVITNTMDIGGKVRYYLEKYDDEFRLITNRDIRIVGYMLV